MMKGARSKSGKASGSSETRSDAQAGEHAAPEYGYAPAAEAAHVPGGMMDPYLVPGTGTHAFLHGPASAYPSHGLAPAGGAEHEDATSFAAYHLDAQQQQQQQIHFQQQQQQAAMESYMPIYMQAQFSPVCGMPPFDGTAATAASPAGEEQASAASGRAGEEPVTAGRRKSGGKGAARTSASGKRVAGDDTSAASPERQAKATEAAGPGSEAGGADSGDSDGSDGSDGEGGEAGAADGTAVDGMEGEGGRGVDSEKRKRRLMRNREAARRCVSLACSAWDAVQWSAYAAAQCLSATHPTKEHAT
jgi:hypothetical protein